MLSREEYVPTYVEVNRVALRDGLSPILRAWYWVRLNDVGGCGWLTKNNFVSQVMELGVSKRRAEQIHKRGEGVFWNTNSGDYIRLVALGKIGQNIGMDTNEGRRVYIPIAAMFDLRTFNAFCYATWFARATEKCVYVDPDNRVHADGGKVLSRARLRELFGISKYTQRTYEYITKMQVEEQVAIFKVDECTVDRVPLTESFLDGESGGVWYFDVDHDGVQELLRQIPNRYGVEMKSEKHKKRTRVGESPSYRGADPINFKRVYFFNAKAAVRAVKKFDTRNGYTYARKNQWLELAPGRRMRAWEAYYFHPQGL